MRSIVQLRILFMGHKASHDESRQAGFAALARGINVHEYNSD